MINKITFDQGELVVQFNNGKEATYHNVPEDVYEEFVKAPSVGKYYNANIKGQYN